ncbi:MAG: pro-sigmaK processing inhibitor BofA family protein [Bacilli bacterium]|nr:pro-sigmaK processing inhibitor BofA family protein [Bacilli bacterium]
MIKKICNLVKKFILAVLLIYAYNKMTLPLDLFIPMNIFTILLVTFCGIPSIIMLILFSLVCI